MKIVNEGTRKEARRIGQLILDATRKHPIDYESLQVIADQLEEFGLDLQADSLRAQGDRSLHWWTWDLEELAKAMIRFTNFPWPVSERQSEWNRLCDSSTMTLEERKKMLKRKQKKRSQEKQPSPETASSDTLAATLTSPGD